MVTQQLIAPKSIVVIGASNDLQKPGGRALANIKNGNFDGELYAVNPKTDDIQGVLSYPSTEALPNVDLAILAIPAKFCTATVATLVKEKNTKAIIIYSAGFSEMGEEGKKLEKEIVTLIEEAGACMIGPNCIGVMNQNHQSVFTTPVPQMSVSGCDFVSSSGATAVFIMESALNKGLSFSSVFSVGNASQTSVEDVLEYLDTHFDPKKSSKIILLYMESIQKPQKFLQHCQSLAKKGCRIAGVKAGASEAGSRAAASHTGAMLNSDTAVEVLFEKAGVIRCYGREELTAVGAVLQHPELKGKNIAIITHAGGPAVMLTDAISNGGLTVPSLPEEKTKLLLEKLYEGSSVSNPIDILATGNATQLKETIITCEKDLDEVDGIVVVFGSPGLFSVADAYEVIKNQQQQCKKPIYAVLPSVINAKEEMQNYTISGGVYFEDEVTLGNALTKVARQQQRKIQESPLLSLENASAIRTLLEGKNGMLATADALELLDLAGITRPKEALVNDEQTALSAANEIGFPLVMKVVGPAHKSEVGGVILGVSSNEEVQNSFAKLINIENAQGVQISKMEQGIEIFIGVKKEGNFGHIITCGLGGIFVEVLKDIQCGLAPINENEALKMIQNLKSYPIIKGIRGKEGIDEQTIVDTLCKVSALLSVAPQIEEMDINPLMGLGTHLSAVDVVIKL